MNEGKGPPSREALYGILEFLESLKEPEDAKIWSRLLEKTAAALSAEAAVYFYYDAKAQALVPFYALGRGAGTLRRPAVPAGRGLCGWVEKFRESALLADASGDARFDKETDALGEAARTALCVPLLDRLDFVGALEFLDKAGGPFGPEDLRFAETACRHAALTLRRLRLEGMINRVTSYNSSILDNLSGGFLAVDLQGRVMICNPAARRILDLKREVIDLPVEQALDFIPELAHVLRRALGSKQTLKRQELHWSLEGRVRRLGYSTLLIQDTQGAFTGVGVTFQDLTQVR